MKNGIKERNLLNSMLITTSNRENERFSAADRISSVVAVNDLNLGSLESSSNDTTKWKKKILFIKK